MIQTQIEHDPRRVYRLIGPDLYSAPALPPSGLHGADYEIVERDVVPEQSNPERWEVAVRDGAIWLRQKKGLPAQTRREAEEVA